jgi:hypothetical protein
MLDFLAGNYSGPEVGLWEARCHRMPTQPRVRRSAFLDNFWLPTIHPELGIKLDFRLSMSALE